MNRGGNDVGGVLRAWRSDTAVSPVIATLILVVIVVITSGGLYATLSAYRSGADVPPAVVLSLRQEACRTTALVTGTTEGIHLDELRIVPPGDASVTAITVHGRTVRNATWQGQPEEGLLMAGDELVFWAETTSATFLLMHPTSNTVLGPYTLVHGQPDAAAPTLTADVPATFGATLASISGSAADDCSGVASVALTISDLGSGDVWDGSGFSSGPPAVIAADVASAGNKATPWMADISVVAFATGHTYRFDITATDAWGATSTTVSAAGLVTS